MAKDMLAREYERAYVTCNFDTEGVLKVTYGSQVHGKSARAM